MSGRSRYRGPSGSQLRAEYRRRLAQLGVKVGQGCDLCGGPLDWQPASLLAEALAEGGRQSAAFEVIDLVMSHGGDGETVTGFCVPCGRVLVGVSRRAGS